MNYGLPYKGSKNRVAKRILDVLPAAPVLYDVFAGGCAITHAALLSGKYSRVVANDINGMIPHAFERALNGDFNNESRWISREEFFRLKNTDPYVALCFSFSCNLSDYCYGRDIEPYMKALHYAIFWQNTGLWKELCPETYNSLNAVMLSESDRHKRRLLASDSIISALLSGLSEGSIGHSVLGKPIYKNIKDHPIRLVNVQHLGRILAVQKTLQKTSNTDVPHLIISNKNYYEMHFRHDGIIYCDPPYKNTRRYFNIPPFDYERFYQWCEQQELPVYISECSMPENRFVPIAEFTVTRKPSALTPTVYHERLWRPICQLGT